MSGVVVVRISQDELAILATAVAIVQKDAERRRGLVLCADGRPRRLSRVDAVDLIDRLSIVAGYKPGELRDEAVGVARGVKG